MKAELDFESENPEQLKDAVGLSLESSDKVSYSYKVEEEVFKVKVDTQKLGSLRGATDSVFRLVSLSEQLR
jgi:tRNA threonylcarbamoyladenosine modification (KEOPS) complex  Pcc1 subunit